MCLVLPYVSVCLLVSRDRQQQAAAAAAAAAVAGGSWCTADAWKPSELVELSASVSLR